LKKFQLYHASSFKFLVIAHRGASKYAPENTFSAFEKAFQMKADMIELDLLLSKDGIPVVIHDENLTRLAGVSANVSDLTFEELQKLDVGSWFHKDFKDERIPSLEEVLTWAKNKISLNIEIKSEAVTDFKENGIEKKVIDLVREFEMGNHVLLSSFDERALVKFHKIAPEIAAGYLFDKKSSREKSAANLIGTFQADAFHIGRWDLRKKELNSLKDAGIPVMVFTVNDRFTMRRLIKRGVFGIFSDRPDRLKAIADKEIEGRIQ
jgi:glycerophosphoryl diester phosphodiesterase